MIYKRSFISLNADEILEVYKARMDPSTTEFCIKKYFSLKEHIEFIKMLKFSSDKKYFAVYDEEFLGVISFVNIAQNSAEFGLYKSPRLTGVGKILMNEVFKTSLELGLKSINAKVFKNNIKAVNLYKNLDFKVISQDENILLITKSLVDI